MLPPIIQDIPLLDSHNEVDVIDISNYKKFNINGTLREYKDKYEYVLIEDYEEILPICIAHTMGTEEDRR